MSMYKYIFLYTYIYIFVAVAQYQKPSGSLEASKEIRVILDEMDVVKPRIGYNLNIKLTLLTVF